MVYYIGIVYDPKLMYTVSMYSYIVYYDNVNNIEIIRIWNI